MGARLTFKHPYIIVLALELVKMLSNGPVKLRLFSPSDLEWITKIEWASFNVGAYSPSELEDLYKIQPEWFFVAEISGHIVGYAIGFISSKSGEVISVAVDPAYRNMGVGRNLLERLIKGFKEKGIETCSLEVLTTNEPANKFYKGLGFHTKELLENYYGAGKDAYEMSMSL